MVTYGINTAVRKIADSILVVTAKVIGIIDSAAVLAAGTGYVDAESITLTGVSSGATNATATVSVTAGEITAINIVSGGDGYTDGEVLTVIGGTGSSGTGTATASPEEWFAEDITIDLSNAAIIAPIVVDFSYDVSSVIEYTLDGGTVWQAFNGGVAVVGGQSRFIRVTDGNQVNFRAIVAGNINRVIVSVP